MRGLNFLVAPISQDQLDAIVFEDEGQGRKMMTIGDFLKDDKVYASHKGRMQDYLEENGWI